MPPFAKDLVNQAHLGGITLVLGAGVSLSRGVPLWRDLVARLWSQVLLRDFPTSQALRNEMRDALLAVGYTEEQLAPFALQVHPFELQFALEIIGDTISRDATKYLTNVRRFLRIQNPPRRFAGKLSDPDLGGRLFAEMLRNTIYEHVVTHPSSKDTLATIARAVEADFRRGPRRRIARIITFNVDDLLEQSVNNPTHKHYVVWPVARESHHPTQYLGQPIPMYHVHGYLPQHPESGPGFIDDMKSPPDQLAQRLVRHARLRHAQDTPDALVFTDLQYWNSVASPLAFANRVIAHALHDSRCVFIGVSMTDANLVRWLGTRATSLLSDIESLLAGLPWKQIHQRTNARLRRHFWIRPDSADPTSIVRDVLKRRGVMSVPIDSWESDAFETLTRACFHDRDKKVAMTRLTKVFGQ